MRRSFDPVKFLELARDLAIDGKYERECRSRTAMGRIYYAAFLVALQKLREKGIVIQDDEKIHRAVIQTYIDKGLSNIGDILDKLREKRVDADYRMLANVPVDQCSKYAELSEYVIELVEQLQEIR
jgi:uncharacterized protein (UPF0332 family)